MPATASAASRLPACCSTTRAWNRGDGSASSRAPNTATLASTTEIATAPTAARGAAGCGGYTVITQPAISMMASCSTIRLQNADGRLNSGRDRAGRNISSSSATACGVVTRSRTRSPSSRRASRSWRS